MCQYGIMKNMIRHHTSAITIQMSSVRSSGSFHHTRSEVDEMVIAAPWIVLFRDRQSDDLHHAPDDVEHGGHRDADEEQQERVVEELLHGRGGLFVRQQ